MRQRLFENDVKMYGTQTKETKLYPVDAFENDVKIYGTQTRVVAEPSIHRLRMM